MPWQYRCHIGGTGAGGHRTYTGSSGHTGNTAGRMGRVLFCTDQHRFDVRTRMLLKKGHMATPGYPKTVLTPSASRHLIIASAPIILLCSFIYTPLFLLFQTLLHQAFGQFHGIRRILGIAVGTDLIRIFLRNDSAADDDLGGDALLLLRLPRSPAFSAWWWSSVLTGQ